MKIVPIQRLVETSLENIVEIIEELGREIDSAETFRITLKSRFSPLNPQELIIKAASYIDRKVNLTNPDRILMIQILGVITGISLLRSEDILLKSEFEL